MTSAQDRIDQFRPRIEQVDDPVAQMKARIAELDALLREADRLVTWETAMPNGRAFQDRVERALGIGTSVVGSDDAHREREAEVANEANSATV